MGDNADTVFVIFVFIMVLLFFILLVKRLYMRQNLINALSPGQLAGVGQLPGGSSHLHENRGNSCPTWTNEMHQGPLDTAPPPFEAVVGASKGDFKADLSSTSLPDMDCPPPSYEEYLGIVNQAFSQTKESPEKV